MNHRVGQESPAVRSRRWPWRTTALSLLIIIGGIVLAAEGRSGPLRAGEVWAGIILALYAGLVAARVRAVPWWDGTPADRAWAWGFSLGYWSSTLLIGGRLLVALMYHTGLWRVP